MRRVFTTPNLLCDVYEGDDGAVYLVALCAGIAWYHVGITLTEPEVAAFRLDPESVVPIARRMCFDFTEFHDRSVSPAIQEAILQLDAVRKPGDT